jgi:eukaryotic-like serine/threonine-protein kinase
MAQSPGDGPRISGRSPRQRDRQVVQRVQRAVVLLDDRGEPGHAGWLLLALVEPELRRVGALHDQAQAQARAAAKLFAKAGLLRAATEVWLAAGAQHHAAQALWQADQDALGNRISGQHGRTPLGEPIAGLSLLGRQVSAGHRASFDEGLQRALHRLEALSDAHAVLALYDGLGLRDQAAERAQALGLGVAAAPRLLASGRPFDAARLWARSDDHQRALDALFLVAKDSPSYRAACVLAVSCAEHLDQLRFELDHLVGPFCSSRPQSSKEIDALRSLAGLYQRHGRLHSAREILEGLYASEPQLHELGDQLDTLTRMMGQAAERSTERRGRGRADRAGPDSELEDIELPSLPDLPELTPLPRPLPPQGVPPRRPAPQGPTIAVDRGSGIPPLGVTLAPFGATPEPKGPEPAGSQPTMDFFDEPEAPVEPARTPRPVGPGALVAGRYRVEDLLGQGGMGAVYRAFDQELSEPVALKILTGAARSEAALARFRQELRLARKLTHRNIVRVHDLGIHAGQRFITMELLQGADLRVHMDSGSLPRREAIDLIGQSAAGLQAAHDMGVVHRDVKPENLFVTLELVVKVMDFGIARTVMAAGMTMDGAVGGTATYMAPEQASGFSSVDARADQYGLGVVAYELLAGRPPFQHEALVPLLHMHATEPPPSLVAIDPSIPEPVEEAIFKALAKDPSDRFEDCIDFGRDLVQAWETPYHVLGR